MTTKSLPALIKQADRQLADPFAPIPGAISTGARMTRLREALLGTASDLKAAKVSIAPLRAVLAATRERSWYPNAVAVQLDEAWRALHEEGKKLGRHASKGFAIDDAIPKLQRLAADCRTIATVT